MTITPLASDRAATIVITRGGHRSPGRMALRRFLKHRAAVVSLIVLALILLAVLSADLLARYQPNAIDLSAIRSTPGAEHWLGTDGTGRDVFSRLLHAGRVSFGVGIASAALAVLHGHRARQPGRHARRLGRRADHAAGRHLPVLPVAGGDDRPGRHPRPERGHHDHRDRRVPVADHRGAWSAAVRCRSGRTNTSWPPGRPGPIPGG